MARTLSYPGVYRNEKDVSDVLVVQGISVGGTVIKSKFGPTYPTLLTNEQEFIDTYGTPYFFSGVTTVSASSLGVDTAYRSQVPEMGYGAYAAIEYLRETNALYVIRDATDCKFGSYTVSTPNTSGLQYTTSAQSGVDYSPGDDSPEFIYSLETAGSLGNLTVYASTPSEYDKNVAFTIEPCTLSADWLTAYDDVNTKITTSASISSAAPIASNVFKISVYVKSNNVEWDSFKTNAATSAYDIEPVEVFYGSMSRIYNANNESLFIEDVVNGNSNYVYVKSNGSSNFDIGSSSAYLPYTVTNTGTYVLKTKLLRLGGGSSVIDTGLNSINSWSAFENREKYNVNVLICHSWKNEVKQEVARIAAKRKDCVAILQSGVVGNNTPDDIFDDESYSYAAPSYVALYSGYSKIYDKYNNKVVWIPKSIEAARVIAKTLNDANPWDAPAGISRGILPILDEMPILSQDQIGVLYDKNINCTKFLNGIGYVMWGQKTAQFKKSALDRLNVRLNLLYIENNIERSLLQFVFQNNTAKERQRIYTLVDDFLKGVAIAGGLYDYKVVCDETNNTTQIIDTNQLIVDIYVQPVKAAEFITLNTIVTRTGATVTEA